MLRHVRSEAVLLCAVVAAGAHYLMRRTLLMRLAALEMQLKTLRAEGERLAPSTTDEQNKHKAEHPTEYQTEHPTEQPVKEPTTAPHPVADPTASKEEPITLGAEFPSRTLLSARHVSVGRKLGAGSFGVVHQGCWRGIDCALKFVSPDAAKELLRECDILDQLEHPNVMRLFGVCVGTAPPSWPTGLNPPAICCELMTHGTFLDFLSHTPARSRAEPPHWAKVTSMLHGAARGLGYLHSLRIIHRDLKALNLLIDSAMRLKIADFGLAKTRDLWMRRQTASIGTYTHMAPEVMHAVMPGTAAYDESSDIFSFGIVISEAISASEAEEIIDETRTKDFGLNAAGPRASIPLPPRGCSPKMEAALPDFAVAIFGRPSPSSSAASLGPSL